MPALRAATSRRPCQAWARAKAADFLGQEETLVWIKRVFVGGRLAAAGGVEVQEDDVVVLAVCALLSEYIHCRNPDPLNTDTLLKTKQSSR
jgi:hypothetical protein